MTTTELKQRIAECISHPPLNGCDTRDILRDCLKHIEELEESATRNHAAQDEHIAQLQFQLRERDADCAAMREALFLVLCRIREWEPTKFDNPDETDLGEAIHKAKTVYESTTAGRELLERLQKAERLRVAAIEFINDWRKGDFELCKLAACDAEAISEALQPKEAK